MTPQQIALVQNSFSRAALVRDRLGIAFYDELFSIAPGIRGLFPQIMHAQQTKLVETLSFIVNQLTAPNDLQTAAVALAQRHRDYGAQPSHFALVGLALLAALRRTTPGGLSAAEANAWADAYAYISDIMIAEFPSEAA